MHRKWILPIVEGILQLGARIKDEVLTTVTTLDEKYAQPLRMIDAEQSATEKALCEKLSGMIGSADDLKGLKEFAAILGGDR